MHFVLAGTKGGSSKTTTAISLATGLTYEGHSCVIIDGDPEYQCIEWGLKRERLIEDDGEQIPKVKVVACTDPSEYIGLVEKYEERYDYVITDLPGMDAGLNRVAMLKANIVIFPVLNSGFDHGRLPKINQMVATLKPQNPTLQAYILPSAISTHHKKKDDQLKLIKDRLVHFDMLTEFPAYTHLRSAYSDCTHDGFAPQEWGDNKAKAEVEHLVAQLLATEENLAKALEAAGV